jgi:methyl-accepting chemotaxis protein
MKTWSLGVKLALQITLVITLVMAVGGVLSIYQQERKFTHILHNRAEWMTQQLALTIKSPLWNMDSEQLDQILHSYLTNPDILEIEVRESAAQNALRHLGKKPASLALVDLTQDPEQRPKYTDAFSLQTPIAHEGETIGDLQITFSRHFISTQTRETMIAVGILLLSLICIEALILLILVKKKISDPLAANVRAATQIANGAVEVQLAQVKSDDEIGALNAAFHNMIAYLHEMAAGAEQIAVGDLQRQFVPKSTDDVLGDAFLRMTHYLKNMAQTASAIANGDLRHEVQPTSERDELGTAFQQMSFLREIVSQLMDGSMKLESSSGDLQQVSLLMSDEAQQAAKQIHSVSSNSKQVNQHVTDIAVAISQSSATVREISTNTRKVADVATEAMQIANSTSASIATLASRSREIGPSSTS